VKNLSVMILAHEKDLTYLLKDVLAFNGFNVRATNNPDEALLGLGSEKYDVFITNYLMKGKKVLPVIQQIRHAMKLQEMKIIVLTYMDLGDEELSQLGQENVVYLKKPVLPNEFVLKIEGLFS